MARHVRFATAGVFASSIVKRGAEDCGPKHNAAMEGQFAIDSAAAGADTDEICAPTLGTMNRSRKTLPRWGYQT